MNSKKLWKISGILVGCAFWIGIIALILQGCGITQFKNVLKILLIPILLCFICVNILGMLSVRDTNVYE